jgi:signal transduction histidine kinase/ActR/RegA family two-component response regulator
LTDAGPLERRVLVLAPSGKDAALIDSALQRGAIVVQRCASSNELLRQAQDGVGAVVLAEEAIALPTALLDLQALIDLQPAWSDLPVVLLAKPGPPTRVALDASRRLGNVTLVERPVLIATLVGVVRTALRTRERQYLARSADQRKDAFLATLAHELRNPLAPLSNSLHLLRRAGGAVEQHDWALEVMQRQLQQLTRLIDDLLDVARITRGKVMLKRERVDARDVIRNAIELSMPLIEAMQHVLQTQVPDRPLLLDADSVRLAQCLSNLLNNAAKYTPPGGRIELQATTDESTLELAVTDNGIGIPAEALDGLFDIFSQVDPARALEQGGLGIGLSLVKAFVEMHGGKVRAYSAGERQGSRFVVRLPMADAQARPADEHAAPAALPAQNAGVPRRILVVDDNVDSADSLCLLLTACGHHVTKAYNGLGGLAAAEQSPPDLAILDLGLPDIDGFELASRLHSGAHTGPTLLVALSGWGQEIDRQRSAAAGFAHHLIKPAEPATVLDLIRAAGAAH